MEAKRTKKRTKKKRRRIVAKFRQQTNDPQRNNQQGTVFSLLRNQTKPNRTKPNRNTTKESKPTTRNSEVAEVAGHHLEGRARRWRAGAPRPRRASRPAAAIRPARNPVTFQPNFSSERPTLYLFKKKKRERELEDLSISYETCWQSWISRIKDNTMATKLAKIVFFLNSFPIILMACSRVLRS